MSRNSQSRRRKIGKNPFLQTGARNGARFGGAMGDYPSGSERASTAFYGGLARQVASVRGARLQ